MATFLDYLTENKLDELYRDKLLHKHFFGAVKVQRRGRLKWKIGITRSIIHQRRKRGVKMFPVEAHVRNLTLLKQLYIIKRSRRLWYYFYAALRFKMTGLSGDAVRTAHQSKSHFEDYQKLKKYLKGQGIEHAHHHSLVLSREEPAGRLRVAQVSDLETGRLSELAVTEATDEVVEALLSRRGPVAHMVQGLVNDTVEHAVDSSFDRIFEEALHVVGDADIFVTVEFLQSSRGHGLLVAENEQGVDDDVVSKYASLYEQARGSVAEPSTQLSDVGMRDRYARQAREEEEEEEEEEGVPDSESEAGLSLLSMQSDKSYLLSTQPSHSAHVLLPTAAQHDQVVSYAKEQGEAMDALELERENECLRQMLRSMGVVSKEPVEEGLSGGPGLEPREGEEEGLSGGAEMTLHQLDAYLNEASSRASVFQGEEGKGDDSTIAELAEQLTTSLRPEDALPQIHPPPSRQHEGSVDYMTEKEMRKKKEQEKEEQAKTKSKTASLPPISRLKKKTVEERKAERKDEQRRVKRALLLHKAEDIMSTIEEEDAKARGDYSPPQQERLLSTNRTLPDEDLIATTRVAKQLIRGVRAKLNPGNPEVIGAPFGSTEMKLMESPFGTPFVAKYAAKVERAERERRRAELLAVVSGAQSTSAKKGRR